MFGSSKNKTEERRTVGVTPSSNGINCIVHGTRFEGSISADKDLRIDGQMKGTIVCSGKIIIGPSGVVEGEIKSGNAVIEGKFNGQLEIEDLLHVKESAEVEGEITTDKLVVQAGAKFNVMSSTSGAKRTKAKPSTNGIQHETVQMN